MVECQVETPYGVVVGARLDGVSTYRRVRYASAPIGPARFKLPAPTRWTTPYHATKAGPIAPQLPSRLEPVMGRYPVDQDEDCLHLDIWSSFEPGSHAPVMVFLHGGAFVSGGGSLSCYDGTFLARSGVVVVNVSYRLGILGFLPIPGVAPANLGLHDQIAALHWIQESIGAFGGDADQITVVGQSAGAYSAAAMMANSKMKGLFRRAILMSAPLGIELRESSDFTATASGLAQNLSGGSGEFRLLKEATTDQLLSAMGRMHRLGNVELPIAPVLDDDLIPLDPAKALITGTGAWCNSVIGVTRDECNAFHFGRCSTDPSVRGSMRREHGEADGPHDPARSGSDGAVVDDWRRDADIQTKKIFSDPLRQIASAQFSSGATTFAYRFDWQSPDIRLGACHCIDLPFLFGDFAQWKPAYMLEGAAIEDLEELSQRFRGALVAFVRTGNVNTQGSLGWRQYGADGHLMRFDRYPELSGQ